MPTTAVISPPPPVPKRFLLASVTSVGTPLVRLALLLSRVCLSAGRRREAAPSQPATWLLPPGYGRVGYESIRRADPRYAVTFRCRWLPSPSSTARLGQGLRRAAGRRRCVPAPLQLR